MKKFLIAGVLFTLIMSLYFVNINKESNLVTTRISNAIQAILENEKPESIFTDEQMDKLITFRDDYSAINFPDYHIEIFQPEDEEVVYLMLIVQPTEEEPLGLVLYMTFKLASSQPLSIEELIISNWVNISIEGQQF